MPKRRAVVTIGTLGLERTSSVPLYRQLYDGLREAILSGRLRPGARLPSTRALADDLGTSRNTVLTAFGQLLDEGYLQGRVGAGTTVAGTLPETLLRARPETAGTGQARAASAPVAAWRPPPRNARQSRRRPHHGPPVPARAAGARRLPVRAVDATRRPAMAARLARSCWTTAIRPATRRCARRSRRTSARRAAVRCEAGAGDRGDGRPAGASTSRRACSSTPGTRPGSRTRATWARAAP